MDIGEDNGLTVSKSYADKAPFAFTGTIEKVSFDLMPGRPAVNASRGENFQQ
jgi:arylsulfatase